MSWFWRIVFTLVLLAGWGALGYAYVDFTLGSPKRDKPVQITIPPNTSLQQIGWILKKNRLIREAYFFRYYAIYKKKTHLRAGVYVIEPGETLDDILNKFAYGEEDKVRVTIPEGWTCLQIADELGRKGFDKEGFLKALKDKPPVYDFEKKIPNNPNRPYRLDGYLFPNTYYFYKEETPEQIVNDMLKQFDEHMKKIQAEQTLASNPPLPKGMTIDQWVTVASIVQREAKVRDEFPRIAGVIYNRLNSKTYPTLDVDATVVYVSEMMKNQKLTRVTYKDLGMKNPYNTYKNPGLPPGPISNPGEEALKAALHPEKHKYYFYVTREDGSNRHFFATTLQEHDKYKMISRQNRKKRTQQAG